VSATLVTFDPWSATLAEALRQSEQRAGDGPDPLAQHQAAQDVLRARSACVAPDGGCAVLRCLALCLANALTPPRWLADAFVARHAQVAEANALTWDAEAAFGRAWPAHTRLAVERRNLQLRRRVHDAVMRIALQEPEVSINRALFDRIGGLHGINVSGSQAESLYYAAVGAGATDAAQLTTRRARRQSLAFQQLRRIDFTPVSSVFTIGASITAETTS
jgi:hypothetical protein